MNVMISGRALGYKALAIALATGGFGAAMLCAPDVARADGISSCTSTVLQADGTSAVPAPCGPQAHAAIVELDYSNSSLSGNGGGVVSYPAAVLRYGLSNNLEVDAYGGSYERWRADGATGHGYADSSLGVRYRMLGTGRLVVAGLATATLPTGNAGFTAGKAQYAVGLTSAYSVASGLLVESSIAYATKYQNLGTPLAYTTFEPAIALVTTPSRGTSFYVAGSGVTTVVPGAGPEYALGAGVRRQLGTNMVLDLGLKDGVTLVNGSRSHEIDVAFSRLIK